MIKLDKLPKLTEKGKKRLGQGHGSGKGKTAGRGTKGQNSRGSSEGATFSAGKLAIVKRLPLIRGKLRNKPHKGKPVIVNLKQLSALTKDTVVDIDCLVKKGIVTSDAQIWGVKILGDGELAVPLTICFPCSKSAAKKIISKGGKVEYGKNNREKNPEKANGEIKVKGKTVKEKNG